MFTAYLSVKNSVSALISGAVSMATLPPASHPEVAFIGRSNVGKSSLINMLANKKKCVTYITYIHTCIHIVCI